MIKHIYIRVDGNEIIATGHVMRCLAIAGQLKKQNIRVTFVVADDNPIKLINQWGFQADVLNTSWNDLDSELSVFTEYIRQHDVKVLLLDTYYVTKGYLQKLSQYTKIIYIDDLQKFAYPVHTIINYDVFEDKRKYLSLYENCLNMPQFLLGSSYVPLREEFSYQPYMVKEIVEDVLLTTGGTDRLNITGYLLEEFMRNSDLVCLKYHVIVGIFNQNKNYLYKMSQQYDNIIVHENITNISSFMRACDVAISAGGTTLYELCACGIPTICLEIADNQEGAVAWEQNDYMQYAGNACLDMNRCVKSCAEALHLYKKDCALRKSRSFKMQKLIDGNGARIIAEYLGKLLDE